MATTGLSRMLDEPADLSFKPANSPGSQCHGVESEKVLKDFGEKFWLLENSDSRVSSMLYLSFLCVHRFYRDNSTSH